jgi:hypothetical protein
MGEASPDELMDPVLEGTRVDGPSMSPSSVGEDVGAENVDIELAFWNSIKDSGSVAELEAYLGRYPDGPFTVLAQTRRDALIAADESDPIPAKADEDNVAIELAFWEAAKDSALKIRVSAQRQGDRASASGWGRHPQAERGRCLTSFCSR